MLSRGQNETRGCTNWPTHYARRLEAYCLKARPYQWFNFYDFWSEEAGA